MRFRPAPHFRYEATQASREQALDQNPWIYRVMAQELFREKKAFKDFFTPSPDKGDNLIADPRRYMFVEMKQQNQGRGLAVAVKLKGYDEVFYSHRGDSGLTNDRTGWGRMAVELPRPVTAVDLEQISIVGLGRGSATVNEAESQRTVADSVARSTWASATPSTLERKRVMRLTHDGQVMPWIVKDTNCVAAEDGSCRAASVNRRCRRLRHSRAG